MLRALTNNNFDAKLKISYAATDDEPNDFNFKWSKIDPKEMQSFLVDIQRKGEEDELIKEENHQVQSIYQE